MVRKSTFAKMKNNCNHSIIGIGRKIVRVLMVHFISILTYNPIAAQTQQKLIKHSEVELDLNANLIGFHQGSPEWIGNSLLSNGVQLGFSLPLAPNLALIAQGELQTQYHLNSDYYCDIDCATTIHNLEMQREYLIKPFLGVGLQHYFMSTGLWIRAMYIATYAPFYSGSAKLGSRKYYNSGGTVYEEENYSLTTFNSIPSFQRYLRLSLGYQIHPFKPSGLGFGIGIHSTLGKNEMVFDIERTTNQPNSKAILSREKVPITQNAIGFSVSVFVPLHELKK